jgi:dienelactone hydrolase
LTWIGIRTTLSKKVRRLPRFPPTDIKTPIFTRTYFRIPLSDGTSVAAYLYEPVARERTGVTMITTHGFLSTVLVPTEVKLATVLVEEGHQVIAYDSRQHGNSTTIKYAYYKPDYFPKAMISDPLEVIAHVKKMPNVDAHRLGFVGFSYGGITALSGAVVDPDVRLLIAGCAVYNYNKLWGYHLTNTNKALRYATKEVFFHNQRFEDFHDVLEEVSPENRAHLLRPDQTVCLLHCKDDPLVVFDINHPFTQAAYQVPADRSIVFETGSHNFRNRHDEMKTHILHWISAYLPENPERLEKE